MDCRLATETLSATLDGEAASPVSVAQAREHCAGCPECAALLATMERMSALPETRAPEHVIARILEQTRAEASMRAETAALVTYAAPASGVVLPLEPVRPGQRALPAWWKPSFTPLASAAAVVLVMSVVSTYALVQMTGTTADSAGNESIEIALTDEGAVAEGARDGEFAATPDAAASTMAAPVQSAPPYLVWSGTVWVRADGMTPSESTLTSAGVLSTDLGEPDGPKDRGVFSVSGERGVIYVRATDGGLVRFARVTRTLGGRTYGLTTGDAITTFGTWPTLPPRFPVPSGSDGSPTFAPQGFDDLGRDVFTRVGAGTDEGFAVAPGTPASDPAAGNPGWTWWQPIE